MIFYLFLSLGLGLSTVRLEAMHLLRKHIYSNALIYSNARRMASKTPADMLQTLESIPDEAISYKTRKNLERKVLKNEPIDSSLKAIFAINWNHYAADKLDAQSVEKALGSTFANELPLKNLIVQLVANNRFDTHEPYNNIVPLPHIRLLANDKEVSRTISCVITQALKRPTYSFTIDAHAFASHGELKEHITQEFINGLIATKVRNPAFIITTTTFDDAYSLYSLIGSDRTLSIGDANNQNRVTIALGKSLILETTNHGLSPDKDVFHYVVKDQK